MHFHVIALPHFTVLASNQQTNLPSPFPLILAKNSPKIKTSLRQKLLACQLKMFFGAERLKRINNKTFKPGGL